MAEYESQNRPSEEAKDDYPAMVTSAMTEATSILAARPAHSSKRRTNENESKHKDADPVSGKRRRNQS